MSAQNKTTIIHYQHQDWQNFLDDLNQKLVLLTNQNLIINLLNCNHLTSKNLKDLSSLAILQAKKKLSLVIVTQTLSYDQIPEILNTAPTLTEAQDLIDMEEIERDLGF